MSHRLWSEFHRQTVIWLYVGEYRIIFYGSLVNNYILPNIFRNLAIFSVNKAEGLRNLQIICRILYFPLEFDQLYQKVLSKSVHSFFYIYNDTKLVWEHKILGDLHEVSEMRFRHLRLYVTLYGPQAGKMDLATFAIDAVTDQPAHSRSLIRACAARCSIAN